MHLVVTHILSLVQLVQSIALAYDTYNRSLQSSYSHGAQICQNTGKESLQMHSNVLIIFIHVGIILFINNILTLFPIID